MLGARGLEPTGRVRVGGVGGAGLAALPRVDYLSLVEACRRLTREEGDRAFKDRVLPIFWSPYSASYAAGSEEAFAAARAAGLTIVARVDPVDFSRALQQVFGDDICDRAVGRLARRYPEFSAKRRATALQLALGTIAVAAFTALAFFLPSLAFWLASAFFSLLFLSVAMLRMLCLVSRPEAAALDHADIPDAELPIYTILVPLHRETEVLDRLARSLCAIDYPREKLDIKFILEASDPETRTHAEGLRLPDHFELLVVPDRPPRTKPKALNYGLEFARGSLLAIYDAEDAPAPDQLKAAVRAFAAHPPDVACVQAPLAFYNARESRLTRQMAIEYAVLYDLILPTLTALNLPVPLGGTSNHFRVSALRAMGGWDPYNVTEDADLGLRLSRFGWRIQMIGPPTLEEAPCKLRVWMGQRVRWLKGWMQTVLVHLRSPVKLWRQLGPLGFLATNAFVLGMVASALLHPFFALMTLYFILTGTFFVPKPDALTAALGGASLVVLLMGYGVSIAASYVAACKRCPQLAGDAVWLPLYWILISVAGWRAVGEFLYAPFRWNKTKHGLTRRPDEAAMEMERAMGIEPTTSSLGSLRSTTELRPQRPFKPTGSRQPVKSWLPSRKPRRDNDIRVTRPSDGYSRRTRPASVRWYDRDGRSDLHLPPA